MGNSRIEQLYATHCTYASSALHRASDRGDQVFEYSARSGSVAQHRTHQVFKIIEPYVRFELPGDTPAPSWLEWDGATCPWRRLAYFPDLSGHAVVLHSAYRTTDTRNRPGSYFAHVLLSQISAGSPPALTLRESLQLFGSDGWTTADQPQIPFDLPALGAVSEFPGFRKYVNDESLLAFLTVPPGAGWMEPRLESAKRIIPERFRQQSLDQRRQLLRDLLGTSLELNLRNADRLVVAVEPSLAALLFYGLARLHPFQSAVEKWSCSTYQSHLESPVATLSAFSFFNPETSDLPPERYRARALNTFNGKRGAAVRSHRLAEELIELFASPDGESRMSRLLTRAAEVGATRLQEMEEILAINRAVVSWPGSTEVRPSVNVTAEIARAFLVGEVERTISEARGSPHQWREFVSVPGRVRYSLTALADPHASPLAETLCRQLLNEVPLEELSSVVNDGKLSGVIRSSALVRAVREAGEWPDACLELWNGTAPAELLMESLAGLDSEQCGSVIDQVLNSLSSQPQTAAAQRLRCLLSTLSRHCAAIGDQQLIGYALGHAAVRARLDDLLRDAPLTAELLERSREQVAPLTHRLHELLDELPLRRRELPSQIALLQAGRPIFDARTCERLDGWQSVISVLREMETLYSEPPGRLHPFARREFREQQRQKGERLVSAARRAYPDPQSDPAGRERAAQLIGVASAVAPSVANWSGMEDTLSRAMRLGRWPEADSRPEAATGERGGRWKWPAWSMAAAVLMVATGSGIWLLRDRLLALVAVAEPTPPPRGLPPTEPITRNPPQVRPVTNSENSKTKLQPNQKAIAPPDDEQNPSGAVSERTDIHPAADTSTTGEAGLPAAQAMPSSVPEILPVSEPSQGEQRASAATPPRPAYETRVVEAKPCFKKSVSDLRATYKEPIWLSGVDKTTEFFCHGPLITNSSIAVNNAPQGLYFLKASQDDSPMTEMRLADSNEVVFRASVPENDQILFSLHPPANDKDGVSDRASGVLRSLATCVLEIRQPGNTASDFFFLAGDVVARRMKEGLASLPIESRLFTEDSLVQRLAVTSPQTADWCLFPNIIQVSPANSAPYSITIAAQLDTRSMVPIRMMCAELEAERRTQGRCKALQDIINRLSQQIKNGNNITLKDKDEAKWRQNCEALPGHLRQIVFVEPKPLNYGKDYLQQHRDWRVRFDTAKTEIDSRVKTAERNINGLVNVCTRVKGGIGAVMYGTFEGTRLKSGLVLPICSIEQSQ